jgi:hypothetical protein
LNFIILQEEDLYKVFANDNPELSVEAIRVPRDPQSSISKGFGFVLFKTEVRVRLDISYSCVLGAGIQLELWNFQSYGNNLVFLRLLIVCLSLLFKTGCL